MKPQRVRLSRRPGFRIPANTIVVARPGKWGNPFIVNPRVKPGSKHGATYFAVPTVEDAVECYRLMVTENAPELAALARIELRGRNLACWCPLDRPCHADVLLEIANEEGEQTNG